MKPLIREFDKSIVGIVQYIPRSWDPFFLLVTRLGDPLAVVVIAALLALWAWSQTNMKLALSALIIPGTLIVGGFLKYVFERARPIGDFSHLLKLDTFSFPSGHSSGSMIAYGLLAYIAWKMLPAPYSYGAATVLMCIPILVGISRIYLSVHYPSDVLAGWLLGFAALCIIVFIVRPLA